MSMGNAEPPVTAAQHLRRRAWSFLAHRFPPPAAVSQERPTSQAVDLISGVRELHGLGSQQLSELLKDSENFLLKRTTEKGLSFEIDVEKLARFLPCHLIAVILSAQRDEASLRYLLCGLRLLHSLCEIAPVYPKLEQILLDDVKVSEQLLDLVFYLLTASCGCRQERRISGVTMLLHSVLVACSLCLLTACISSQWHELAYVLLAHPKVDMFMDVAFRAIQRNIHVLQRKLAKTNQGCTHSSFDSIQTINYLCQQCEASLQFFQSLCQVKSFRERLFRNKELCGKGGVLQLVQVTLKLGISPLWEESRSVVSAVSRLKSRALSILLHLCEAESTSYLDEVASVPRSLNLAKSVVLEVVSLLKTMLTEHCKQPSSPMKTYPMGLLQLNALRLADIFSDDSNFRSYMTLYFSEVLAAIFTLPYLEFLASWCSSNIALKEEEPALEYEPFAAAGWILHLCSASNAEHLRSTFHPCSAPQPTYAHHRTSLLVKVIANLHCFIPKICEEQERNLFLRKFHACLRMGSSQSAGYPLTFDTQKAVLVCKNLGLLLSHAESLIPTFLNEEDVQLLRVFYGQLQPLVCPDLFEVNRAQAADSIGEHLSFLPENLAQDFTIMNGNLKEGMSENSAVQEGGHSYPQDGLRDDVNAVTTQYSTQHKGKIVKGGYAALNGSEKDFRNIGTSRSDSSSNRAKNIAFFDDDGDPKSIRLARKREFPGVPDDEKVEGNSFEDKRPRKRKRTVMNDKQVSLIEKALLEEPDLQKNTASLQSWAEKLSLHGSEVTPSQIKNWLNNRKARLARAAARDGRHPTEVDNGCREKQGGSGVGPSFDSPESRSGDLHVQSAAATKEVGVGHQTPVEESCSRIYPPLPPRQWETGQLVMLIDGEGKEIAKAKVHQVQDEWDGINLKETNTCVVDIIELQSESYLGIPHISQGVNNNTSDETKMKIGSMRVLWDSSKMSNLQQHQQHM
ncbi:hypothetical protein Dimus_009866 [Dionaea muscipula]